MKKLIILFKVLVLLIIIIAPAPLGLIEAPLGVGIALAALGALWYIGCVIFNVIYMALRTNELMTTSADVWQDYFEKQKDEIRTNGEKARKKVSHSILLGLLYGISLMIATAFIAWGLGMIASHYMILRPDLINIWGKLSILIALSAMIFAMFGLTPAGTVLFAGASPRRMPLGMTDIIRDKDFPLLYAVADRAAKAVGYTGKFHLRKDLEDYGISVTEEYGVVFVYLSPTILSIMTENELYCVLLHEFSHATNSDTKWYASFSSAVAKFDSDGRGLLQKIKSVLFAKVEQTIYETADLYRTYSSLEQEQCADEAIKEYGDTQAYINCTAKDCILTRFLAAPNPELYYNIYESETPVTDYYEHKRNLFEKALPTEYDRLEEVILRTLPGKSDSHPTLSMRMKSLGVADFDVFARPEGEYLEELNRFVSDCSKIYALDTETWKENRKTDYIEVKERLEKFEAKLAAGDTPDKYELWESLTDYSFSAPEKALGLADKILKNNPEDKRALAVKGMILCALDNSDGLAILRKAADKANVFSATTLYKMYGDAVLRSGDEKLLEEFRAEKSVAQRMVDCAISRYSIKRPSPKHILPCCLSKSKVEDICCVLNNHGKDFDSVYIATQGNTKVNTHIVLYKLKKPNARNYDDSLFRFLHMLESMENFFFFYSANGKLADAICEKGTKLK
ncbi:MAG: hypothetical protein J1F61_04160 [Clostridiales bacterium]|nr:hypothetical protein [Clostridiales bacterium]